MATQPPSKGTVFRWTTLKGFVALLLFLIVATLIEYVIVLYAINLGVKDETPLQGSFKFPGTDWNVALAISPLFHLVPIAVIIALVASWGYLTRHIAIKPPETQKARLGVAGKRGKERKIRRFFGKIGRALSKVKGFAYLESKAHFARATIRSALIVIVVFSLFVLAISLLTYPQLLYQTIIGAYRNNPLLLGFVKSTGNALSPLGSVFSSINNALVAASPGFRGFVLGIAGAFEPLTGLDNAEKYLVFQNAATWVSAVIVLLYGEFGRKSYRQRKK
jgi:hypothetical protein